MVSGVAISGSGAWMPPHFIDNEELCRCFNAWVRSENERLAPDIGKGDREPLKASSPEFIVKGSGIETRCVIDPVGILDPNIMHPLIADRADDELSVQAEWATRAARQALDDAGRLGSEVDLVILACAGVQRPYPAVAAEIQHALGARGFAYDMLAGCSSATFSIQIACDAVRAGNARRALLVSPEIMSAHANFRDRDSHFLFGDAASALLIEPLDEARPGSWEIVSTRCTSQYSSNIRDNCGFLNRCDPAHQHDPDKLFYQQGRRVFREVVPLASAFIGEHLGANELGPRDVDRLWLHQANANLNHAIAKRVLGRHAAQDEAPLVLARYGNIGAAGSIVAFHEHRADLGENALGVISSFGAGYSIGSVILRRR